MWLVYLVIFVLLGSMIAVFAAVIVVMKNNKLLASIEVVTIRAEVLGDHPVLPEGYTYYDPHKLGAKKLSIAFHTDKDQYLKLNVKQKDFYRLITGMYGELTYHANQLKNFKHLPKHEEARRQQYLQDHPEYVGDVQSDVYFYCNMPSIGIIIETDKAIKANQQQITDIVSRLFENTTDSFCGLDNEKTVLQFSYDGVSEEIVMDIPEPKKEGSYQAIFTSIDEVLRVIEAFFQNQDILSLFDVEFIKW